MKTTTTTKTTTDAAANAAIATGQPAQPALDLLPGYLPTMKHELVDIDLISTLDARGMDTALPPARSLIASVLAVGVLTPIIVEQLTHAGADGCMYRVTDGRRRLGAAQLAGLTAIDVQMYTGAEVSGEVLSLIANEQRSDNLRSDYLHICALETEYIALGYTEADVAGAISRATGMAKAKITSRLNLKLLLPALHDAMMTLTVLEDPLDQDSAAVPCKFPMQAGTEAAKLGTELQARLMDGLLKTKRISVQDVRDIRKTAAAEATDTLPDSMFEDDEAEPLELGKPGMSARETALLAAIRACLAVDARNARKNGKQVTDVPHLSAVADALAAYSDETAGEDE